jgi:hypothetical protein
MLRGMLKDDFGKDLKISGGLCVVSSSVQSLFWDALDAASVPYQ